MFGETAWLWSLGCRIDFFVAVGKALVIRNPGCSLSVPFGKQSCTLSRRTSLFVPHDGENETMTELLLFDSWLTFLDALVWKEELDEKKNNTKQKQTITKQAYSFYCLKALYKSTPPDWLETQPISGVTKLTAACSFKDPVLPIMHRALTIIGGHFLDVDKSEN